MECQVYDGLWYCTKDGINAFVGNDTNTASNAIASTITPNIEFKDRVSIGERRLTVTAIGKRAFKENKYITSVYIHKFIKLIGSFCFDLCSNITKITFDVDSNLQYLNNSAFYGCNITRIIIPRKVKYILVAALGGMSKIDTLIYTSKTFISTSINLFSYGSPPKHIYVMNDYRGETFYGLNVTRIPNSYYNTCKINNRRNLINNYIIIAFLLCS